LHGYFSRAAALATGQPLQIWPVADLAMRVRGHFRSHLRLKILEPCSVGDSLTFGLRHRIRYLAEPIRIPCVFRASAHELQQPRKRLCAICTRWSEFATSMNLSIFM